MKNSEEYVQHCITPILLLRSYAYQLSKAQQKLRLVKTVAGRFAYESFRLLSVRLRLASIRLRPICQFAYLYSRFAYVQYVSSPTS